MELWERFGDDARSGMELGISKAGFRQWRRKYGINEKPLQLRLEQLELPLPDNGRKRNSKRETLIQKLIARKASLKKVEIGQIVELEPDLIICQENVVEILEQFEKNRHDRIWDPSRLAFSLAHMLLENTGRISELNKKMQKYSKNYKGRNIFDPGEGFGFQILLETGKIVPGNFILGSENYISCLGALGSYSAVIKSSQIAEIMNTGRYGFHIPETVKVTIKGHYPKGIYAADLALKIMRDKPAARLENKIFEFYGNSIMMAQITDRLKIASTASSLGAEASLIPIDDITNRFMRKFTKAKYPPILSDADASFKEEIEIDIGYLTPQVACPDGIDKVRPIEEISSKKIDRIIFGGPVNGQLEDLEVAANILKGRRLNHDLQMYIIPASRRIMLEALDRGYLRVLIESGCIIMSPGWSPFGMASENIFSKGERILGTICHNEIPTAVKNDYELYLASPATAAASALEGAITDPRKYLK